MSFILSSGIRMTKADALIIQAEQVAYYGRTRPWLEKAVATVTTADQLEDGVAYDMVTINRHIPRGGAIEALCGVDFGGN